MKKTIIALSLAVASMSTFATPVQKDKTFDDFTATHDQIAYCTGMIAAGGKLSQMMDDNIQALQMYVVANKLATKAEAALPEGTDASVLEVPAKAGANTVMSALASDDAQMLSDLDKCEQFSHE